MEPINFPNSKAIYSRDAKDNIGKCLGPGKLLINGKKFPYSKHGWYLSGIMDLATGIVEPITEILNGACTSTTTTTT